MKKVTHALSVVALSLLAFSQPSVAREFVDIYTQCGLGAMIAPTNGGVAANQRYGLWNHGDQFNISSPDTCKGRQDRRFYPRILWAHRGSGEGKRQSSRCTSHLVSCRTEARGAISAALRKDFPRWRPSRLFAQSRYEQANSLYNILHAAREFLPIPQ